MIDRPLEEITETDVQALIHNDVLEGKRLEYKRKLPGTRGERKALVQETTSFSNTQGGDLIYGIEEESDSGIPDAFYALEISDADAEEGRLDNIIRNGVNPSIPEFEVRAVEVDNDEHVVIIRVQESFRSPHRVTHGGHDKFYGRSSNGKYPLDVDEIRREMLLSETNAEEIREFRADRLAKIRGGNTPVEITTSPSVALHLIPLQAYTAGRDSQRIGLFDESEVPGTLQRTPRPHQHRHNIDGMVKSCPANDDPYSYVQVYKNGIIESVNSNIFRDDDGVLKFSAYGFRDRLEYTLPDYTEYLQENGVPLPLFLFISVIEAEGVEVSMPNHMRHLSGELDREMVLLPEFTIQEYVEDYPNTIDNVMDNLWNAFGFSEEIDQ